MDIRVFPLGQMQANCYFVMKDNTCLLIDPADSADFILEEVSRRNLEIVGLIATHGHFDHVMAVGEIQLSFPHLPLYINSADQFLINRLEETAKHFLGFEPHVIKPTTFSDLKECEVKIGDFHFDVISTPGHTPGSVSLYFKDEAIIFSGDTVFNGGVGRYDFSYSDKNDLKKSVQRILDLPEVTTIYPGHGEETLIQYERMNGTIELIGGSF